MSLEYCRPPPSRPRWLVVCLCAAWCGTCREYRPTLEAMAVESPGIAFAWIDIEEESDVTDDLDIDVETFPTLMIVDAERPLFYGVVLPGADALRRLLRALEVNGAQPVALDDDAGTLARRLMAIVAAAPAGPGREDAPR